MEKEKRNYLSYIYAITFFVLAVFIDQITKLLAIKYLKQGNSIDIIKGVFQLHYLENRGAAFGMLQNQKLFFVITGILVLTFVFLFYMNMPHTKRMIPLRICFVLIASGAIGNMIDRIRLNYVVDFFYFELINFPIFNVADIYVTTAAFFLILLVMFYYKEDDLDLIFHIFSRKRGKKS